LTKPSNINAAWVGVSSTPSTARTCQLVVHNTSYRPDIDGLRAVAVLAVVLFHAFPNALSGGFAGVDVFFVISGFLISSILFAQIELGRFSIADFYARRARRIFPALALVLACTLAFGWFILLSDEFRRLGKHMAAGSGFVANLVLWSESGYFDTAADLKPLLHLWSLGIEEQFYLVWPLLLGLAWSRKVSMWWVLGAGMLMSFGLNIYGVGIDPTGTFFSPLTRFWELLAGAALAWHMHGSARVGDHSPAVSRGQQLLALAGAVLLGAAQLVLDTALSRVGGPCCPPWAQCA
jgi:peptidoglycan/LPS O-acetylase OafA/YrhL